MESPVARVFGIDTSTIAISIGYTCTAPSDAIIPDFFGVEHHRPATIPMDRSCLLNKLRPDSIDPSSIDNHSTDSFPAKKPTIPSRNKQSKGSKTGASSDYLPSTLPMTSANSPSGIPAANNNSPRVEIRLSDFAAMMMDAAASNRTWVQDFSDDQIAIPQDLYEVMLAYQRMRKAG